MSNQTDLYKKLVEELGGQTKAAKELGVGQPCVSAWVNGRWRMSATAAIKAEIATKQKFRASELCPRLQSITIEVSNKNNKEGQQKENREIGVIDYKQTVTQVAPI